VSRGKFALIDSDYASLTPEERAKLKEGIDATYEDFLDKVSRARKKPVSEIEPVAQGRVWLGDQAKERGLVDEIGGIDRALELVKQKAKIPGSENVTIVMYPARRSLLDMVFGRAQEGPLESRLRRLVKGLPPEVWTKGGLLRIMPYMLSAQ
jgi:protease-4